VLVAVVWKLPPPTSSTHPRHWHSLTGILYTNTVMHGIYTLLAPTLGKGEQYIHHHHHHQLSLAVHVIPPLSLTTRPTACNSSTAASSRSKSSPAPSTVDSQSSLDREERTRCRFDLHVLALTDACPFHTVTGMCSSSGLAWWLPARPSSLPAAADACMKHF